MISVVFTHTNVPAHGDFSRTPDLNFRCFYPCEIFLSPTLDRDFRCFYPCEKFLSHIPVPALGKNKHHHVCRTSFHDVIVNVKMSANSGFSGSLFMVSNIKCGTYNAQLAITVCHHSASLVMPIGDPRDEFFYPTLTHLILIISQK